MPKEIKSNLIGDETIDLLSKFQILKAFSRDEIRKLLGREKSGYQERIAKLVRYKVREIVLREGEFDSWVFWVVKGEFAVVKDGIPVTIFRRPGNVFGEMSILEADCRNATVVSLKDGICLSIDMSILDTLDDESVREKVMKGIQRLKSRRLSHTTEKLVAEKRKGVREKKSMEIEKKRLKEKEAKLSIREKELMEKEMKLNLKEKELMKKEKRPAALESEPAGKNGGSK